MIIATTKKVTMTTILLAVVATKNNDNSPNSSLNVRFILKEKFKMHKQQIHQQARPIDQRQLLSDKEMQIYAERSKAPIASIIPLL